MKSFLSHTLLGQSARFATEPSFPPTSALYQAGDIEMERHIPLRGAWSLPPTPYNCGLFPTLNNIDALVSDMRSQRPEICASIRPGFSMTNIYSTEMLQRFDCQFLKFAATQIAMENLANDVRATSSELANANAVIDSIKRISLLDQREGTQQQDAKLQIVDRLQHQISRQQRELDQRHMVISQQAQTLASQDAKLRDFKTQISYQKAAMQSKSIARTSQALDLAPNNLLASELYGTSPLLSTRVATTVGLEDTLAAIASADNHILGHALTTVPPLASDALARHARCRSASLPASMAGSASSPRLLAAAPPEVVSAEPLAESPSHTVPLVVLPLAGGGVGGGSRRVT